MAGMVPPVILKATTRHTATLIFLHGLGDTGVGCAGALSSIRPSYMKVICPTAPIIPVTCNGGFAMPAWYDILSLEETEAGKREDLEGVDLACTNLQGLIASEVTADVPRSRIILGGFSQGGALSLFTALKEPTLAGCLALSAYIPGNVPPVKEDEEPTCETPILQVHGQLDEVVPFKRGKQTNEILKRFVKELEFKAYPNMGHEGTEEELQLMKEFILKKCPDV